MKDQAQTIKRATVGIAILVLLSKGIGFLREVIIAYRFGTGIEYDVYLIAVSIPIALYPLFGYAFSNLFIPRYSYALKQEDNGSAFATIWRDFNLSLVVAAGTMLAIIALAPHLIRFIAPGMDEKYLPEAVLIIRVSSAIVIMAVLEGYFRSVLNAEKKFMIPAAGPLMANSVLIISILSLSGTISTRAILYGLVLGYAAQTLMVYFPFRSTKLTKYFHTGFFHKHSGKFVTVAVIILIIEGASQVYAIVDRYFASSMDPGIISALGYAYLLVMLPVSIFAYALSTVLFPYMSDSFAGKEEENSAHLLSRGITVSLLMALPATMIFWVFSEKIVMLLFHRGAFDMQSVEYTSTLLKYLALGMAGHFLLWVMTRPYYATRKYGILIAYVIVALVAKIAVAAATIKSMGYVGLAVSSSVSYTAGAALLLIFARRTLARVDVKGILLYVTKVLAATAVGYLVAQPLYNSLVANCNDFGRLLIVLPLAVSASVLVILVVGFILRIGDIRSLPGLMRKKEIPGDDKN